MRLIINNNYNIPRDDYCIEFDIIEAPNNSTASSLNLYDSSTHNVYFSSNTHYKIVMTDKIYPYANSVPLNPISYSSSSTFQLQFTLRSGDISLKFRNFVMYYL